MMMMTPLLGGLLLACVVHLEAAVTELTDQNFYEYAKDKDVLLVDFYAPWCGDCKALDPDFENAASSLGTRSIDLAKVDCFGAGKSLCSTYGIHRWPTLKNFNRGQYTGDYTGGLSTAEIAGYVNTVENSVHPVVNPYAAPFAPVPQAAVTQQCVSRCRISKITNKTPCYARCKTPRPLGRKMLPQPVINEKSCAKCRQPQIAGKFSHHCSLSVKRACSRALNRRRHKSHRAHTKGAQHHKKVHKRTTDTRDETTAKKATIGTLTAASNDNVVKLSMGEPLIVPPNAEHRKQRQEELRGVVRESKATSAYDATDRKHTAFDATPAAELVAGEATTDDGESKKLSEREQTLKLINEADDKKKPVLSLPSPDKYIQIPPHDAGDKKTKLKNEKQVKYPLPKVPAKPLKPADKIKFTPKFLSVKVPPHDSGDLHAAAAAKGAAAAFAAAKAPHKPALVGINRNIAQKLAFAKRLKAATLGPRIAPRLHVPLPNGKQLQKNVDGKTAHAPLTKSVPHPSAAAPLLPMVGPQRPPVKKGLVKLTQPVLKNSTGIILSSPLAQTSLKELSQTTPIDKIMKTEKIVALNRIGPLNLMHKKLEAMTPREALKVPYDADDKKRTLD